MPKIEAPNSSVRELRGLHLYHAGWSNCSMRVRMTLEEKGLTWTSHHLNTRIGEHITPEYFSIHPHGLVPALVHDGNVWIESSDIIRYLDGTFPEPPLTPSHGIGLARLAEWQSLASTIHITAVKTYIYAAGQNVRRRKSAEELERYRKLQSNEELLAFHARSSSDEGINERERDKAERLLHDTFAKLDEYLGENRWLAGDDFTLADIIWLPLQYTLERTGFSFDRYTNVLTWAQAIAARPSFQKSIVDWFDGPQELRR